MAGTALGEPRCADFVAGTALCEPRCADFVAGKALSDAHLSLSLTLTLTHAHTHSHSHAHTLGRVAQMEMGLLIFEGSSDRVLTETGILSPKPQSGKMESNGGGGSKIIT